MIRSQVILKRMLLLFLVLCMLAVGGCSVFSKRHSRFDGEEVLLSQLLPEQPKVIKRTIPEGKLEDAIQRSIGNRRMRVVRIYRRNSIQSIPEHRVFDVTKGSPFDIIGLRSGDIILGVNDRLILEPAVMELYPQAVLQDKTSTITFNRNDELFQIKVVVK